MGETVVDLFGQEDLRLRPVGGADSRKR